MVDLAGDLSRLKDLVAGCSSPVSVPDVQHHSVQRLLEHHGQQGDT